MAEKSVKKDQNLKIGIEKAYNKIINVLLIKLYRILLNTQILFKN